MYVRGGPFDTQGGGGGFVNFRKKLSGFHLLKHKLSGSHVVRTKLSGPRRATNFVAWSFLIVQKNIFWLRLIPYRNFTKTNMDLDSVTQNTSDNTCTCMCIC